MVEQEKKARRDYWKIPALLIFWAILGLIGYDIYLCLTARRELTRDLNHAARLVTAKQPWAAADLADQAQLRWIALKDSRADRFLTMLNLPLPTYRERFTGIYRALGQHYYKRKEYLLASRAYGISLLHDPANAELGAELGESCFYSGNYELGHHAGQLCRTSNSSMSHMLLLHFSKRFTPDYPPPPLTPAAAAPKGNMGL